MYGERVSKGYYSEGVGILNASYNLLSGYSFAGVSLGLSIKGAFRFVPDYSSANDTDNKSGSLVSGSGKSQSTGMAMADIGVLTRFDFLKPYDARERNTSAALVLRNLGPPAQGDPLPTVATVALSYKPLRPLLLAFDFSLPMNLTDISLSERPYWSAGISAQITNFLSMRMGFMSKAGNARITVGSAVDLAKLSFDVNYTLDLLTQLTPLNRVSIGVRFNLGDQGRQALSDRIDELYLAGLNAYSRGNNNEAQYYWEEALKLNPRFIPAIEGLNMIRRSLELEERINDMQRLDF
jgi:hypothetical protein